MTGHDLQPWLIQRALDPAAPFRLFCFHQAGGTGLLFAPWIKKVPGVEIVPIQLPGRGRQKTPVYRRLDTLVDDLARDLDEALDRPFAFFGYSLGALLAYELTLKLVAAGRRVPERLIVCARRPPASPMLQPLVHGLPEPEFRAAITGRYGALPPEVLEDAAWMSALRADLEILETYRYVPHSPLVIPIVAYGGDADPVTPVAELEQWRERTTASFTVRMFSGGHFFLRGREVAMIPGLCEDLGR